MSTLAELNMKLQASASIICNDPSSNARLKEMESVLEAYLRMNAALSLPRPQKNER